MKALRGWAITAGLIFAATAANAQAAPQQTGTPQYQRASDFNEPYADVPPQVVVPDYGPRVLPQVAVPQYGPGVPPDLLPPREVYAVLRENGFSPLGVPRLRGLFYSIAAISRRGDDGRLVIDARDGRIIRFVPAEHFGGYGGYGGYGDGYYGGAPRPSYGYGPLEPMTRFDGPPRPQASVPKIASRMPQSVPLPKAAPSRSTDGSTQVKPLADKLPPAPAPMQQSAAVQAKPADTPPAAPSVAAAEAKPAPAIQATQPMPKVQGLE